MISIFSFSSLLLLWMPGLFFPARLALCSFILLLSSSVYDFNIFAEDFSAEFTLFDFFNATIGLPLFLWGITAVVLATPALLVRGGDYLLSGMSNKFLPSWRLAAFEKILLLYFLYSLISNDFLVRAYEGIHVLNSDSQISTLFYFTFIQTLLQSLFQMFFLWLLPILGVLILADTGSMISKRFLRFKGADSIWETLRYVLALLTFSYVSVYLFQNFIDIFSTANSP